MHFYETGPKEEPKMTKESTIAAAIVVIGLLIAIPGIIFLMAIINAFVISTLWGWYIVPFFLSKPLPLSIAFGLSLLIGYMQSGLYRKDDRETKEKIIQAIVVPSVTLFFGWAGTFFI